MTQATTTEYDEQSHRADVDAAFASGEFSVYNGWIIETVNGCTCGTGGLPAHELGCGAMPVFDLAARLHKDTVAAEKALCGRYDFGIDRAALIDALIADSEPWVYRGNQPHLRFTEEQKRAIHGLDLAYEPRGQFSPEDNPIISAYLSGTETAFDVMSRLHEDVTPEQRDQASRVLNKVFHLERELARNAPAPFDANSDFV